MTASNSPALTKSPSRGPTRITLPDTRNPTVVGADGVSTVPLTTTSAGTRTCFGVAIRTAMGSGWARSDDALCRAQPPRKSATTTQAKRRPGFPFMVWPFMLWLLNPLANGSRACDRVVRDIHLAHEGDCRVRLCILDEILQHSHAGGPAGNSIVRADGHHATAMLALFVQHVELTFQIGCVCVGAEVPSLVVHNVVHMQRVGHHGEGLVPNVHQEWLIAADVVDVVGVAKLLQNLERLRCTPQPERIEADWPHAGDSLDGCGGVSVTLPLLFRRHGILRRPGLAVTGWFVATLDNLFCQRRVLFDCDTHHVRGHLYLAAVEHFQQPRQAFLEPVLV